MNEGNFVVMVMECCDDGGNGVDCGVIGWWEDLKRKMGVWCGKRNCVFWGMESLWWLLLFGDGEGWKWKVKRVFGDKRL